MTSLIVKRLNALLALLFLFTLHEVSTQVPVLLAAELLQCFRNLVVLAQQRLLHQLLLLALVLQERGDMASIGFYEALHLRERSRIQSRAL